MQRLRVLVDGEIAADFLCGRGLNRLLPDLAHVLEGKNQLKTVELKGVDFSASKTDKIYININMDEDGTTPLPGTLTNLDVTGAKGLSKVYVGAKAVIEDANFKHDAGVELVRANK